MYEWRHFGKGLTLRTHLHELFLQSSISHWTNDDIIIRTSVLPIVSVFPDEFSPFSIGVEPFYTERTISQLFEVKDILIHNGIVPKILFGPISSSPSVIGCIETTTEVSALLTYVPFRGFYPLVRAVVQIYVCHSPPQSQGHHFPGYHLSWSLFRFPGFSVNVFKSSIYSPDSPYGVGHRNIQGIGYLPHTVRRIGNLCKVFQCSAAMSGRKVYLIFRSYRI